MQDIEAGEAFARASQTSAAASPSTTSAPAMASFTYLKRLPARLPQDRHRLRAEPGRKHGEPAPRQAIVGLAQDFGYETIAEGVEDAETLSILAEYGVDYAQGYHSRPTGGARRRG